LVDVRSVGLSQIGHLALKLRGGLPTWAGGDPIREELFGPERLEQHGESLAAAQRVGPGAPVVVNLHRRLKQNAAKLLSVYRGIANDAENGVPIVPAAEWLLDNFHLAEEQIQAIRHDLPAGYYKQLPKLVEGPFAGYPRVFGIAWAYVAHSDSHFDAELLKRFLVAYQRVQPLTIGELWAIAITLKIVLIENLRRLADQMQTGRTERAEADRLADALLAGTLMAPDIERVLAERPLPLSDRFIAQLAKRLRDQDPQIVSVLGWLDRQVATQGLTVEEAVRSSLQRQSASNLTVRNIITSMRTISSLDWGQFFESVSLVDARLRRDSDFARMDFPTRDLYRNAIEDLSRRSKLDELQVVDAVLERLGPATPETGPLDAERLSDPGFHLIAGGRRALERSIGFRPRLRLLTRRAGTEIGIGGYVALNAVISALIAAAGGFALRHFGGSVVAVALFVPCLFLLATEITLAMVNRVVTWLFGPVVLPGLELKSGIPAGLRSVVAVPTLLTSEAEILEQIEGLEVRYLASAGGELIFALLIDGVDAQTETLESDERLLAMASTAIDQLNARHGPTHAGERFLLLYRRRLFNSAEGKWMGWERKRGKLHEFNRLLRGATDTSFVAINGRPPKVPPDVRYVLTLDADTRLPRESAERLVGKLAHPLNRPRFDPKEGRVVEGYAVLQPRVTPALPLGNQGSLFQRVFSGPAGIDPYAAAVSDTYQDLFGEGSFTGKGIYDVDAFEAAMAGRVPDNTMLSHDLFEGTFARAGLATDIEVVEDFPTRYDVDGRRRHRWVRGDWQLLPWILGLRRGRGGLPAIGRWKMIDNLRRSVLPPATLAALTLCLFMPSPAAGLGILLVLAAMAVPVFVQPISRIIPHNTDFRFVGHFVSLWSDLQLAARRFLLQIAFLADDTWRMLDAIVRTLYRMAVSKRHLLEWTTAAQAARRPRLGIADLYREMAPGTALGIVACGLAVLLNPGAMPLAILFTAAWLTAPAAAHWTSLHHVGERRLETSPEENSELRQIARRTWRYFETFVTPEDNMLPPDNFQETPDPVVAHRTSPTNIGLYLLSAVVARDFGWAGTSEIIDRLEATFATLKKLPGFMGHFFNWYDTRDLRALDPQYVSTVDSGNLAGHLIALARACEEWRTALIDGEFASGLLDTARVLRKTLPTGKPDPGIAAVLDQIEGFIADAGDASALLASLRRPAAELVRLTKRQSGAEWSETSYWASALANAVAEHARDRTLSLTDRSSLDDRLDALATQAREMALRMDFSFLLDPDRKLLSIGYSPGNRALDSNCYDLLASECRLGSLFAIAKGDIPTAHWFRLGRSAAPVGTGSALISWSGSMFEYLMPSLVMRAPVGSLLEQTNRLIVQRQEEYGQSLGIPWGVSESSYNARDAEMTYQYHNFGVPGLGLKRGLSGDVVIAPYATGLAAMVDPHAALSNYHRLAGLGALGRFGYYEAVDFTRSRLPEGQSFAIVRSHMAHHQGMTIVAIADTVQNGRMRSRFHQDPMIQAADLLLQERVPRDVPVTLPRAEEVKVATIETATEAPALRRHSVMEDGPPVTHLLSNGRYSVMLTTRGGGYSRWGEIAITRWREDQTRDDWGQLFFLRDPADGTRWSVGARWDDENPDEDTVTLAEDQAIFSRRDAGIVTNLEVVVSAEDDGEVRRLTLINRSRRIREIEITTYTELVLSAPQSDNAHPAFSKMFVQTEYLPEYEALLAHRRPRSSNDPAVWAGQFAVFDADLTGTFEYETDRAKFLGRGHGIESADALVGQGSLSGTVGTVLDPVFALRHRVRLYPGRSAQLSFWTVVAKSREELVDLIDKHHDRSAFERARTLGWTQAQVQMRHLDIHSEEATEFQRLAAPILYSDPRFRAPSDVIVHGAGSQSALWPMSISGDRPIVLVRIDDIEDLPVVLQLLRAHEYWLLKGLSVDLVILNERSSSYVQDLQNAIEAAVRSRRSRPALNASDEHGTAIILRADVLPPGGRDLLRAVARVTLVARRGDLTRQLGRVPTLPKRTPRTTAKASAPVKKARPGSLEFFNGFGGFDKDGSQYVVVLEGGKSTPTPWVNVIANPQFGFHVSADGSGFTWSENSRENQLTSWSNDPVRDRSGEAIYIADADTGDLTSPTAWPIRDLGTYIARHGFGVSRFEHAALGLELELTQFVPVADPVKISRLKVRNTSGRRRRLRATVYAEWLLGTARITTRTLIVTQRDEGTGALFARNPWGASFGTRTAFSDFGAEATSWTADRTAFLGRNGSEAHPEALLKKVSLSGTAGGGLDACAAQQRDIELEPGAEVELVWLLGQTAEAGAARDLIGRYRRSTDCDAALQDVEAAWQRRLGAVQVKTPDRAMDIMLNGWLLYQALSCRIWARTAFYQASGAYGFRDQLQDGMALTFAAPAETRAHLLRVAGRQFPEGDVQHWWLPHSGQGVRTRISDDRVWLAYAVALYVERSGDIALLDETIPFIEGPRLAEKDQDSFFQPQTSDDRASIYEHCALALDHALALIGEHGLPLMGTGDWNDGMNRVGEGGRGESVWLGWLTLRAIDMFAPLAESRDAARAETWRKAGALLQGAIEQHAWDGSWYRRASYDDGTWLGSKDSDECRIDSIAQSWAVISGRGDQTRAAMAMKSLDRELIPWLDRLALLFTPPFDVGSRDPGYIKGYPPGLRENGGQYSHAAMWSIVAFAELGDGDRAHGLFELLNPINHAQKDTDVARYKVEPYVIAADVYSVPPHRGRGGWTWYTGSAAWMYRAGVESILGINRRGDRITLSPRIPESWPGFDATIKVGEAEYRITVTRDRAGPRAHFDGEPVLPSGGQFEVPILKEGTHVLVVAIGAGAEATPTRS
jgi:cyclic beta-1,2-glucan synthetase